MKHVVAMPYPGRGHINPMMNLCRLLASLCGPDSTLFTFIVTEEWLGFIGNDPKPANIRFATLPNVIPSELFRGADMGRFVTAVVTELGDHFARLLDRLDTPVNLIIGDANLKWVFEAGNRRKIPVAAYWAMSASVFSMFYHIDLLIQHQQFPVELSERGEEIVDYIPGLSPMKIADFPTLFFGEAQKFLPQAFDLPAIVHMNARCLLFTTMYELEAKVIDALKAKIQLPIYTLGPNIPFSNHSISTSTTNHEASYLRWLDSKPLRSVLYVSLGSYLSVSSSQIDEIAAGLKDSGVSYLWVSRTSRINELCGEEGLVVPWCEQLQVLCHSSVGGFWTHCGWNSVKEAIFAGVPMLTFPILVDQTANSKFITEDWKNGWKVRKGMGVEGFVKREEIVELVRRFMDSGSDERKETMVRVKELQVTCHKTIAEGGSATVNLDAFIREISN